jgi:WD40 repeat protein
MSRNVACHLGWSWGGLIAIALLLAGTGRATADEMDILDEQKLDHKEGVQCIAFSRDGKLLASASAKTVRVWDVSGKEPKELAAVTGLKLGLGGARSLIVFPDNKTIAMGGGDNILHVYDTQGDKLVERLALKDQSLAVQSLALAPDGKTLVSGSDDMTVLFYDLTGDKPKERARFKLDKASGGVKALFFAPDGKSLVLGTGNGVIRLLDVTGEKPKEVGKEAKVRGGPILPSALSPDGKLLVIDDRGIVKSPKFFEVSADGFKAPTSPTEDLKDLGALCWSQDGRILAAATKGGRVLLFDSAGEKTLMDKQRSGHFEGSLAFHPMPPDKDALVLVVGDWSNGKIYLYRVGKKP